MVKTHLKRAILLLVLLCCLILLSSCSLSDLLAWGNGVKSDPDYQTWERLSGNGKLDNEGMYTADAVHVSLATNGHLEVHYYTDAAHEKEITEASCYLLPGDCIYASAKTKTGSKELYFFDHLDIIEYSTENERGGKLDWELRDNGASFMIPFDYKGTEIAVEPVGHFGDRQIVLIDINIDDQIPARQTWRINGEQKKAGNYEWKPLESVTVEYEYDPNQYFIASNSPAPWKIDSEAGLIIFNTSGPRTGTEEYRVDLQSYLTADISINDGRIISITDNEGKSLPTTGKQDRKWTVLKISQGSTICVTTTTKKKPDIECNISTKVSDPKETEQNSEKRYTYDVTFGDDSQFHFIPSEYTRDHGTLKFSCNGKELTESTILNAGMKIQYEAVEVDEGYWLPDGGGVINVSGSKTATELSKIQFYPYKQVSVLLDQPKAGGKIVYQANGEELSGSSAELICGTRITAVFEAEDGWESRIGNNAEYVVSESNNQLVVFDQFNAQNVFCEADEHKPKLKVEIRGNLGNTKTTIEASGIEPQVFVTEGQNKTVISDKLIGSDQDIRIVFSNLNLPDGCNAVRITALKEVDGQGGYKEIRYITKANDPVYIRLVNGNSYKTVDIVIDAVHADQAPMFANGREDVDISARFTDVTLDDPSASPVLTADTLASSERRVKVIITPREGYFMAGNDVKDDVYQREMSFDEYIRIIPEVLNNQVKKIYQVTLNTEDPYGNVEYIINGQSCQGLVNVRDGQEIIIKYELTDDNYVITDDRTIFDQAWNILDVGAGRRYEKRITMNKDLNGKEIKREDYIKVGKKGN